jgi:branched-chain amino acid transport system permease protein
MTFFSYVAGMVGVTLILVAGLQIVSGMGGLITIAQAAMAGVGAYAYGRLVTSGMNPWLAAGIAILLAILVSVLSGALLTFVEGEQYLVATLALQLAVTEVFMQWEWATRGVFGIPGIPRLLTQDTNGYGWTVLGISLVVTLWVGILARGKGALLLRMSRDATDVLEASGQSPRVVRLKAYVMNGMVAGIAGVLFAGLVGYLAPINFGTEWSIGLLVMLVIGGPGNAWGGAAAGVLLGAMPEMLRLLKVPNNWIGPSHGILYGLMLVVIMAIRPDGLFREQTYRPRAER